MKKSLFKISKVFVIINHIFCSPMSLILNALKIKISCYYQPINGLTFPKSENTFFSVPTYIFNTLFGNPKCSSNTLVYKYIFIFRSRWTAQGRIPDQSRRKPYETHMYTLSRVFRTTCRLFDLLERTHILVPETVRRQTTCTDKYTHLVSKPTKKRDASWSSNIL